MALSLDITGFMDLRPGRCKSDAGDYPQAYHTRKKVALISPNVPRCAVLIWIGTVPRIFASDASQGTGACHPGVRSEVTLAQMGTGEGETMGSGARVHVHEMVMLRTLPRASFDLSHAKEPHPRVGPRDGRATRRTSTSRAGSSGSSLHTSRTLLM
ncbi:hypothetical protein PSPO01_07190 [Paraphaeosphaeria sporulosa]